MRLKQEIIDFLKHEVSNIEPNAQVYLFGSRVDDTKKGGDIDILILSEEKINLEKIIQLKVKFYKQFGEQKIDIVNFTKTEQSPFKQLILMDAILL
jgi:predicted nucleotidyltransferase